MDILDQAIEFEYLGHKMYTDFAAAAKSEAAKNIFEGLAADELTHVDYIRSLKEGSTEDPKPTETMYRIKQILIDASKTNEKFLAEETDIQAVLDKALDFELKSKLHYERELEKAVETGQKKILSLMVKEEDRHHDLIKSLITYLDSPKTILETSEFHWYED